MVVKVVMPECKPRFVGVKEEAKRVGCSEHHLWATLHEKRESKSLMNRIDLRVAIIPEAD